MRRRCTAVTEALWRRGTPFTAPVLGRRHAGDGTPADDSGGYRFFEEQCPPNKPAERFATYEDQLLGATASRYVAPVMKSQLETLRERNAWERDEQTGVPRLHPAYGWDDARWGPAPGEPGHSEWYKADPKYLSLEEQAKLSERHGVPLALHELRHQAQMPTVAIEAAAERMMEDERSEGRARGVGARERGLDCGDVKSETKASYVGTARKDYVGEWLQKPGVTRANLALKVAEELGTTKDGMHGVKTVFRNPEWQMTPVKDDDD